MAENLRSSIDDIIDLYMKDVDMSLIRENLKLTPEERIIKLTAHVNFILELRRANERRLEQERGPNDDQLSAG